MNIYFGQFSLEIVVSCSFTDLESFKKEIFDCPVEYPQ